jgi:hypothetical protein
MPPFGLVWPHAVETARNPTGGTDRVADLSHIFNASELEILRMTRKPIGTEARTGENCPESGVWKVKSQPTTTAPIAKGNTMPPYDDKAVVWVLIQYA